MAVIVDLGFMRETEGSALHRSSVMLFVVFHCHITYSASPVAGHLALRLSLWEVLRHLELSVTVHTTSHSHHGIAKALLLKASLHAHSWGHRAIHALAVRVHHLRGRRARSVWHATRHPLNRSYTAWAAVEAGWSLHLALLCKKSLLILNRVDRTDSSAGHRWAVRVLLDVRIEGI